MAASRVMLLRASSSSLLMLGSRYTLVLHRFLPSSPLRCASPLASSRHKPDFRSKCSVASSIDADDTSSSVSLASASHPWPEWVAFMDRLKSKGYFEGTEGEAPTSDDASSDVNHVKFASLSFARERFDILRSLSKADIKAIVEHGCPNLFRKSVNSAKRLRAFVELDEADVCSSCNLRGSCDRAYANANQEEGARTVDIVRLLLNYAMDPLILSKEKSHDKVKIEAAACRLLAKLTEMSDAPFDPEVSKPAAAVPRRVVQPKSRIHQDDIEMKRGDWICPKCNFMNFARNLRCLECKEEGPKSVNFEAAEMKKGDWACPTCNFMNFSRNISCKRCQETRPKQELDGEIGNFKTRLGDWPCPQCNFINFARNTTCRRCQGPRKRQLNPGEWECPSCDFLNFGRNSVCLKCDTKRPSDGDRHDQVWKRPAAARSKFTTSRDEDDEDNEQEESESEDDGDDDYDYSSRGDSKTSNEFPHIIPMREGGNKYVVSKRRSPSERRLTSARNKSYQSSSKF